MRLRLVSPRYGEEIVGGAETLIRDWAQHLQASGHEVAVLTTCARDHFTWANELPAGEDEVGHVRVMRYPVDPRDVEFMARLQPVIDAGVLIPRSLQEGWVQNTNHSSALFDAIEREADAGALLIFAPYLFASTVIGARLRPGRSVIVPCLHDEAYARWAVVQETLHGAALLLFNSTGERGLARRICRDLPRHEVVGVGFDPPDTLDPSGFRHSHRVDDGAVVYAGRREAPKNFPLLLDWMAAYDSGLSRHVPVQVVLIGAGAYTAPPELHSRIVDVGFVPRQKMLDGMASCLALINLSRNESLSYVVMESWLAGTPVIVHRDAAVTREHCEVSGGGLWVGSAEELAVALDRLRDDAQLRSDLAAAGRAYVRAEWSWGRVMGRLEAALASVQ